MRDEKKIASWVKDLEARNGGLVLPQQMVDEARDPEHEFHELFEWDDAVAGEKYRRHQAREIIRLVKVVVHTEQVLVSSVGYVSDPNSPGYRSVDRVRSDREMSVDVLKQEFRRLEGVAQRIVSVAISLSFSSEAEALESLLRSARDLAAGLLEEAQEVA